MPYAIYATESGRFRGWLDALPPDLAADGSSATFYETRPSGVWDAAQRMFVAETVPRLISKRRFMARITVEEYTALNAIRLNPDTPLAVRASLETAQELRDMVTEIDLNDPAIAFFVPVAIDLLIDAGLIAAGDRAARIAAWTA